MTPYENSRRHGAFRKKRRVTKKIKRTSRTHAMRGGGYEGERKDDKHGHGKYTGPNGEVYDGEHKDDKMHGHGKYTWPNGQVYEGELKDGKKNGMGKYTWPDGQVYEGEWKDGKKNGRGKHTWPDGEVYEGEYKDDKRNGRGKNTWPDGQVYEGEYKDDKQNGMGKYKYPDGTTYEGEFKDDEFSGYGEYTNVTPSENYHFKYRGYYDNGVKHGFGYIYTSSGRAGSGMMYGEFKNDKLISGSGRRIERDGTIQEGDFINGNNSNGNIKNGKKIWPNNAYIYEGEFDENGECHGKGSMIAVYDGWNFEGIYNHGKRHYGVLHDNGDVYEGEFENNRPHGKGTRKYADGKVHKGRFVMNKPDGPNAITSLRRTWEELGITRDDYVRRSSSTRKHSS